jgi:hypothetical protein
MMMDLPSIAGPHVVLPAVASSLFCSLPVLDSVCKDMVMCIFVLEFDD